MHMMARDMLGTDSTIENTFLILFIFSVHVHLPCRYVSQNVTLPGST